MKMGFIPFTLVLGLRVCRVACVACVAGFAIAVAVDDDARHLPYLTGSKKES